MSELDPMVVNYFLDDALELLERWDEACYFIQQGNQEEGILELSRAAHSIKGSAISVGLTDLGKFVHKVEDFIKAIKNQKVKVKPEFLNLLFGCHSLIKNWVINLKVDLNFSPEATLFTQQLENAIVNGLIESVSATPGLGPTPSPETRQDTTELLDIQRKRRNQKRRLRMDSFVGKDTIRIERKELDHLLKMVGNLSIQFGEIFKLFKNGKAKTKKFESSLSKGYNLSKQVQENALAVRTLHVGPMLKHFSNIIEDMANDQYKDIDVEIIGEDESIDKAIIEKMMDPLIHLVKNAVDHGIETRKERKQTGKPKNAKITLKIEQVPGKVIISITDDGKGLDSEKILEKALDNNYAKVNEALDEKAIFNLILAPGFSTSEKINEISGRGVGMNIVKHTLDLLGGKIHIASQVTKGTTFFMSIPSSINIVEGYAIEVKGHRYILPAQYVIESKLIKDDEALDVIELKSMPPFSRKRNSKNDVSDSASTDEKHALVVKFRDQMMALKADKIIGKQKILIEDFKENANFWNCVSISDGVSALYVPLTHIYKLNYGVSSVKDNIAKIFNQATKKNKAA